MSNRENILVTGGLGFIGSHTVVALAEAGYNPVILDSLENAEIFILDRLREITGLDLLFYEGDCRDLQLLQQIFSQHKIQGVIHFAAYKAVGESVEDPVRYFDNNLASLWSVLRVMKDSGTHKIIFSSSCTVYGNASEFPVTEETSLGEAFSPYGYTKQAGEHLLKYFTQAEDAMRAVVLRYFNPIGAHPNGRIGELPKGVPANLVPFITQTAAGWRQQLTIHGNDYQTADGTCIRDYIHVCDLADAHVKALQKIEELPGQMEIINLGTGRGNSVLEVIHGFEEISGIKIPVTMGPRRRGDIPVMYASVQRAGKLLDWKCRYSLKDALLHAWQWQQQCKAPEA